MVKLLGIAVLVVAVLAIGVPKFQQLAAGEPRPQPTAAIAARPPSQPAAQPAASAPAASPAAQMQTIEIGEQEVNRLLRERLGQRGYQVDDLSVQLRDGRFVATTSQQVAFFRVPVTIEGEVSMENGLLSVRPVSVTAGGASVPQDVIDQMATTFQNELAASIDTLPIRPTTVQIQAGKIVVQGVAK